MKKILIFGYTLEMGGAEKILVDTIKFLHDKVEIDLYLIEKKGILLKEIPNNVSVFSLKKNIIDYFFFRFFSFYRKLKINNIANSKNYYAAIGYLEGRSGTWVADIKKNIKKYAWIHTDVLKNPIGINDIEAKNTYINIDKIVCVSSQTKEAFCNKYSIPEEKVDVIYNFINEKEIIEKSKKKHIKNEVFTFVNVAKMRKEKGQDRLIKAAAQLKQKGYNFKIQLVGNGPEFENIKNMINEYEVNHYIELLGLQENPYPYIKNADFFVLSSYIEGYGIVVKESLLLQTKILSTDVAGPREMLENGKYGIIVPNNENDLIKAMEDILKNPKQYKYLDEKLKNYKGNNENIKKQILNLLDLL